MNIDKPEQILGIQLMNMFMNQVSSKDKTGMFDIMMQAVMESIEKGDDNNVFKELLDGISSTSNNKNSKTKLDSLEQVKKNCEKIIVDKLFILLKEESKLEYNVNTNLFLDNLLIELEKVRYE